LKQGFTVLIICIVLYFFGFFAGIFKEKAPEFSGAFGCFSEISYQ